MRDDVVFAGRAAFSSTCPFCPLCRDEFKTKTTQMPPLWRTIHCRLSKPLSPTLLLQPRVSARQQSCQPAPVVAESRKPGLFPRNRRNTARAAMARTAPRLLEEEDPHAQWKSSDWTTTR